MTRTLALCLAVGLASTLVAQEPLPAPLSSSRGAPEVVAGLPVAPSRDAPSTVRSAEDSSDPSRASGSLLERFLSHEAEPVVRYRATRRLEAENGRFNVKGWMNVTTELSPERGFTWTIIDEGGSGHIRDKVLRRTLEGEARAVKNNDPSKAALNEMNYTFGLVAPRDPKAKATDESSDDASLPSIDGAPVDGLARLFITPKRKDMLLVDGVVVVAADDADLVQIEGRLSKTPSWWTRSVDVLRRYARVGGIRVPVATESTANVRIAGRSEFRMTYTYQMINGRQIAAETGR